MRDVKILPPSELTGIKFIKNPKKAAGVKGVTVAIRHLSEEIGLFEGLKLMTKVIKKMALIAPDVHGLTLNNAQSCLNTVRMVLRLSPKRLQKSVLILLSSNGIL